MTKEFERLIIDSAPEVPDSGESRRTTRLLLHEKMHQSSRRDAMKRLGGISIAAALTFLIVFGVQVTDLGSDAFEFDSRVIEFGGETHRVLEPEFRNSVAAIPEGLTDDQAFELVQQQEAREGKVDLLVGYRFNGGVPWFQVRNLHTVDGMSISSTRHVDELSVESHPPAEEFIGFFAEHATELEKLASTGQIVGSPYPDITADGITFQVTQWTRQYPIWGTVTYYRGNPVETQDTSR